MDNLVVITCKDGVVVEYAPEMWKRCELLVNLVQDTPFDNNNGRVEIPLDEYDSVAVKRIGEYIALRLRRPADTVLDQYGLCPEDIEFFPTVVEGNDQQTNTNCEFLAVLLRLADFLRAEDAKKVLIQRLASLVRGISMEDLIKTYKANKMAVDTAVAAPSV